MTDFDEDLDKPVQQHPTEYFRAAARFRTLEAEATTPRVKQHLRALIDEYQKLAGKAEESAASSLEGDGFELLVPRHKSRGFPQHSRHCGVSHGAL